MMNYFLAVFKFEGKRLLERKSLFILLMLLVFVLGFFQNNISEFKETQEQKRTFQDFEKKKVDQYLNYRYYGARGFRLFFHPAPISIFFINSVPTPDMKAFADDTEQINFYRPITIKTLFELRKNWFTDYSGILFIIGTLLILFYGYKTLKSSEYLRLPASIIGHKKYFWAVYFARGLWLFVFLLIITALLVFLAAFNGIIITIDQYLLIFLLVSYGLVMMIFSVGFWCGTWKSTATGMAAALIIWMVFIFFIPTLHNVVTASNANAMRPIYKLEMDKLIIYMDWERKMREREGTVKPGEKPSESFKKRMLDYKDNELKKLQAMEENQIAQLKRTKKLYQFLASFFPTTFYQSVNNEISSRGYDNLVDFCKYALGEKLKFIGIVIEKEYFSNYSKVEQFNAGDENIFTAKPKLPEFFLLGILFNLLWSAAFVIPAYYRFKKNLCNLPEKEKDAPQPKEIILKRGKANNNWYVFDDLLKNQLLTLLFNEAHEFKKKGYSFKVFLDDQDLLTAKKQQNFLYLCHPKEIPGHFVMGHFLTLVMDLMRTATEKRKEIISQFSLEPAWKKKFCQLDIEELGNVFLAILELKTFDVYLIDDIGKGMLLDFCIALQDKISSLRDAEGAAVLFLWTDLSYVKKEKEKRLTFYECKDWINTIESLKQSPTAAGAKYPKE
jgi:ABC-type transport system involved in multi-copper enzyme maturation permease subunit